MKQITQTERLDKILSNSGFGTRKDVKRLVRSGEVLVNGETVKNPEFHVSIENDTLCVQGEEVKVKRHAYFMLNKPAGYICSTKSGTYPTVFDLLDESDRRTYLGGDLGTIGRLDADTEGLLIITTDGDLNHRLTSPKWRVPKTYLVHLANEVDEQERESYVADLARGVHIEAEANAEAADCLPAQLEWCDVQENDKTAAAVCKITVYEGKFHEVKRLFAALGNEVTYLKRIRMNRLFLDESLACGQYRELTKEEFDLLSTLNDEGV